MPQFTFDNVEHMLPGQGDTINTLLQALNTGNDGQETVTSGALSTSLYLTSLSVTGTQAYTLANGATVGQRKRIMCTVAASIPVGTLTIATPDTTTGYVCQSTFVFDTAGQGLELMWTATGWRALSVYRAGAFTAVVGTTALTGRNLYSNINLSVTGTVSSTGANALPNGSAISEEVVIGCSTAATIPNGSIDGVYRDLTGVARTHMNGINATTCYATFMWDGQRWQETGFLTVTFS